MTVPARRSRASLVEPDEDFDEDFATGEFYSGERVCLPPDGSGGIGLLRGAILILIALGGGWALMRYQAVWRPWLAAELAAVAPVIDPKVPAPVATAAAVVAPPLPAATTIPTMQLAAVAPPPPGPPAETQSAVTTGSIEPAAAEPPAQPLPPPVIDPLDPYQKRAAAVGLHPQLSRGQLARG
jgi:hypothetical protein